VTRQQEGHDRRTAPTGDARADLLAGGTFVTLGSAFAIAAGRYDLGTALRMGPGYLPLVLGVVLAMLGLVIVGRGARRARAGGPADDRPADGEGSPPRDPADVFGKPADDRLADGEGSPPRGPGEVFGGTAPDVADHRGPVPVLAGALLVAAVAFFGLTVRGLGLAPALFGTAFLAALASRRSRPVNAALVAAGLTAVCLLVFVAVLQLRLPLLGTWLSG
jgi:Tripartite tricarboxylate transporter TctB family